MAATWLLTLGCGIIAGQFHHQVGIAPVLAAILCAALFLRPRDLWLVGLGGMLLRDAVLGFSSFTLVRLAAIALVIVTIQGLKLRPTLKSLLAGLLVSSPIFHLALSVGNWATNACGVWPKTAQGLWSSIATSGPYFQRSLVGDVLFTSLFLSVYSLATYGLSHRRSLA
ncbi:MAG: hypothetical protein HYZ88_01930 [Candidatus Omnitrophica bacterium]|nr:hypothetical protein [Candidatus Omnitrophota bacterium]